MKLSYRDLKLVCKKLKISYKGTDRKINLIEKILENQGLNKLTPEVSTDGQEKCQLVDTRSANRLTPKVPQKKSKEKNQIEKNQIMEEDDFENDFFENLFKEFGINFTTTNKESVLRLRKSLSLKDVELYLRETYQAIKDNKDIVNVAALFSSKIAKGERQINIIKTEKPKTDKKDENKTIEKNIQEKKNLSPVLDLFKDKTASENVDLILENFNSLDPYDKLKIEEKAIILLCDEEKITENFVLTTKQKSPNIYFGMIRKYVETIMNDIK